MGGGSEKCGLGVSPSRAPFQDRWELGVESLEIRDKFVGKESKIGVAQLMSEIYSRGNS